MQQKNTSSRKQTIIGWVFSGLAILFLLSDGLGKFVKPEIVIKTTLELGYPESPIMAIGMIVIISTILYSIPRTAFIGAVLLTGLFGGAIASQFRLGNPLFSHTLFPVYRQSLYGWDCI